MTSDIHALIDSVKRLYQATGRMTIAQFDCCQLWSILASAEAVSDFVMVRGELKSQMETLSYHIFSHHKFQDENSRLHLC